MSETTTDDESATGDRHDEYEWKDNQAWTFEANVEREPFAKLLRAVMPIIDECRLRITPETVYIKAVDPASVCAIEVEADCVNGADGATTMGVDPGSLYEALPPYYPGDPGGYDIRVSHGEDSQVSVQDGPSYADAETVHPDLVREPMEGWPEPDEGFHYDVTLPAPKVRGVLGAFADTDAGLVRMTPTDGEILFEAEKRNGDILHSWRLDAPVTEGENMLVSADYVSEVTEGLYPDGDVRMRFGNGQLLDLETDGLRYTLAARLEQGDI